MRRLHLLASMLHLLLCSLHVAAWSPSSAPHRTIDRRSVLTATSATTVALLLQQQQPARAVEPTTTVDPWATIQPPPSATWPDAASHPLPGGGGDLQQAIQESERKKQIGPTTHG